MKRWRLTAVVLLGGLMGGASSRFLCRSALACGGGLVTIPGGAGVGAGSQRIVFAVHGGVTDVITEIGVPATTASYGVLIPVPAQPTLDPEPVASSALDALDTMTTPRIYESSAGNNGLACGCGSTGDKAATRGPADDGGVQVSRPVNIGPVTAVVLTGETGAAVNDWLASNGFAIPADQQPLVDAYSGAGRSFIALRRNDSAATGGPSSVGVHFTLPVAAPTLPLGFARLGAAPTVTFTVFVAATVVVAPSAPFAALTLDDLDAPTLRSSGYATAVAGAVAGRAGRAFVIEGSYGAATFSGRLGSGGLEDLLAAAGGVTRLTTILPASALTEDVSFDQTFTRTVPSVRYVEARPGPADLRFHPLGLGAGTALAGVFLLRRRRRGKGARRDSII